MNPDIVIPLGTGTVHRNEELRIALRSIERHGVNYRNVIVVGANPGFLSDEVVFLPWTGDQINKEGRIAGALLHAFDSGEASDAAICFGDDYVLNAPVDFSDLGHYHGGDLEDYALLHPSSGYTRILRHTRDTLVKAGKPTLCYDLHVPIPMRRDAFCVLEEFWELSGSRGTGLAPSSIYANCTLPSPGVRTTDCKLRHFNLESFLHTISDRWCYSYNDDAWKGGLWPWLEKAFPQKSRFEQ